MAFDKKLDQLQQFSSKDLIPSFKMNIGGTEFKSRDLWIKNPGNTYSVYVGADKGGIVNNRIGIRGTPEFLNGVSRMHFMLSVAVPKERNEPATYYIRDLQSTNGTFLNGTKLAPGEDLLITAGDIVSIGQNIKLKAELVAGCLVLNQV